MAIDVTIPLERLREPAVSEALAHLMLALGSAKGTLAPTPTETKTRRPRRRRNPPSGSRVLGAGGEPGYREFLASLPDPSRRFLEILEERGSLTMSQAMRALGLTRPKSLGGITGSLRRWAPARGVDVPFEASKTNSGERVWRWTRGPKRGKKS